MTCQNCGHPEDSHDIGHEGQPHYCVTVGGCPCTAYREPEPAVIEDARLRSVHIVPEGERTGHIEPAVTDLPDAGDILHRINMQTTLGSVFGKQTDPDTLYMPTSLICRLLDGEDA